MSAAVLNQIELSGLLMCADVHICLCMGFRSTGCKAAGYLNPFTAVHLLGSSVAIGNCILATALTRAKTK